MVRKEAEKIVKYRDLEIETQKCWNLTNVRTIPMVIGALGTACKGISEYIETISPNIEFRIIQKTALLHWGGKLPYLVIWDTSCTI